jgi:hypothetical protein
MKINKILAAILATVLFSTASMAGELTVTGTARASLNTAGSDASAGASESQGRGIAIENEFVFGASGELDNGTAWKYSVQLDQGEVDDSAITFTNSYGTIGLFGQAGGLNFKHGGSQMSIGYGSQIGNDGITDPGDIGGLNNIQYHTPAGLLPLGTVLKVAIGGSGTDTSKPGDSPIGDSTGAVKDARNYSIEMAPLAGLKLGASYYTDKTQLDTNEKGQDHNDGAGYISYTMGNWGVGYSKAVVTPALASTPASTLTYNYIETNSYSIGVKANDNLSISYGVEKSHRNLHENATEFDAETNSIQAAYTMGGMTIAGALKNIENADYVQNADQKEAHLIITLAF